ncbi:MAG: hypothetical protein ACI9FB_002649 [Candidatus Azotimanducaceae bacterium]|jgi:hypothetical protein
METVDKIELNQKMEEVKDQGRNYWPVLLIAIPFAAVLFGIFMISTTLYFPDDLVVDNYYKDGMAINTFLEQDELAEEMDISVSLISLNDNQLELNVRNVKDSAIGMSLFHVTDQSADIAMILVPEEGEVYSVNNEALNILSQEGVWYIELNGTDRAWRVKQRIETPMRSLEIKANE